MLAALLGDPACAAAETAVRESGALPDPPLPVESPAGGRPSSLDSTLDLSLLADTGPDPRWRVGVDFRSTPVAALAEFLPEGLGTLRGGTVTGRLDLECALLPGGLPDSPIRVQGTLCADSLWWPAGEDYSEWMLRDATFCVDVTIHSGPAGFRYGGFLDAGGGVVRYLNHDFPVLTFRITFLDSTLFDPAIDMLAETPVTSNTGTRYLVRFDLIGPSSLARPQLSAEPGLSRQDIESLLALGIPLTAFSDEHVRRTEGSYWAQQVFMFRAMEVAADRMVGIAEERAQRVLGMDEIYVPTARGLASGDAEMGVAKRLGSRATLSYSTPMWHLGAYRARLDFRLTDHFSLESENDHTGDSGVDLRFKVRWR